MNAQENSVIDVCNNDQIASAQTIQVEFLMESIGQKDLLIQQLQVNVAQLDYRLERARSSLGWKIAKPLSLVKGLWRRLTSNLNIDLIPFVQLQRNGGGWQSTGIDPQFLLMTERAWHGLPGWYWLCIEGIAGQPLNARLYFDMGEGFDPSSTIAFSLAGEGVQRIPVYVPHRCRAIRLDPCYVPITFKLAVRGMTKLKNSTELPEVFRAQFGVYEALGGRMGNAARLVPVSGVKRNVEADYCWRSEGADPWFVIEGLVEHLRPGWYMVELSIHAAAQCGNAKFYFDYGEGFSEAASLVLPFRSGQMTKRLCCMESVPKQIRFDPLDRESKFTVEHVNFTPVISIFARNRMLKRLRIHVAQYKTLSYGQIWRDLRARAKNKDASAMELLLWKYGATFPAHGLHGAISYADWIANVESRQISDPANIETVQESFKLKPTISVIMPVYNTEKSFLQQAIESVQGQSYPHWELCIADDASPQPHVRAVLEDYAQRDPRIKVMYRPKNGHISAASNSALALATGEYVALLDHDDTLADHALHFMVGALNQNPSAQIFYSDEDKIDEYGNRTEPHFKPDWNPDLFFSQNYVCHLGIYRRDLLERIGGFRTGVEGSQDQDLLLRCLPYVTPAEIVHIPEVLYHWRMGEGSTALASGEKSYTTEAGVKALRDYFCSQGQNEVCVEAGVVPNTYRVRYPIPVPEPLVSLLVPTRDMLEVLEPCISSILNRTSYQNYEIIILDNESTQAATLAYFEHIQAEDTRVSVLPYHHPFNYSAINNYGVQHAKGELIGLINNDIEVISPEWLTEMVSHALRPGIGCVGAKLYYADNTIQHAGVILGIGGVANHPHKNFPKESHGYFARLSVVQNFSAVTAACLLVRKTIYEEVGGLEEGFLKVAFNDVDFCLKVREAGFRNLWTPYAELYHHESKSRGTEDTPEKHARFVSEVLYMQEKWKDQLALDPMYSPNLTHERTDFSITTLCGNSADPLPPLNQEK